MAINVPPQSATKAGITKKLVVVAVGLLVVPASAEEINLSLNGMLHRMNCTAQFALQCDSKTGYCVNLPLPSHFYFDLDGMIAKRGDSSSDYANLQQPKHKITPTFATPNPQFDKVSLSQFSFREDYKDGTNNELKVTVVALPNRTATFSVDVVVPQAQHTNIGVDIDTVHSAGSCFLLGPDGQRN
jgi:hypothetical protein